MDIYGNYINQHSVYNSKAHYGLNLDELKTSDLNYQFTAPIPGGAGTHDTASFSLNTTYGTDGSPAGYATSSDLLTLANAHVNQRKFTVGLQWGFDGFNPGRKKYIGENISGGNLFGFDFSMFILKPSFSLLGRLWGA